MSTLSPLRTLIRKEFLRYRYNWGLLVLMFVILAISALLSIGNKSKLFALDDISTVSKTYLFVTNQAEADWASALMKNQLPPNGSVEQVWLEKHHTEPPLLPTKIMAVELFAPPEATTLSAEKHEWRIQYWRSPDTESGMAPYRDWTIRGTNQYLERSPLVLERSTRAAQNTFSQLPLVVTTLVVFAMYIFSFNIFITSTGEEREKGVLLALLLSPCRARDIVLAKAIFYCLGSMLVSAGIVAMHQPEILLSLWFWLLVALGSLSYVSIGTVFLCLVRKQTTLSTVSLLYMVMTTLFSVLGGVFPLFRTLHHVFIEDHLYRCLEHLISGTFGAKDSAPLFLLVLLTLAWLCTAVMIFSKKGLGFGQKR